MNGNIMVDGVLASCYSSLDHDLHHVVMTPLQWFPEVTKWTFGGEWVTCLCQDLSRLSMSGTTWVCL